MNEENGQDRYPLDEATIELLSDLKKQMDQTAMVINAQRQGALILFIRQHKLQGNWSVAENNQELVKAAESVPAGTPQV